MEEREPVLIYSSLNRCFIKDGVSVHVNIFRADTDTVWLLEVINASNTSICWDDPFDTEDDAFAEFMRVVEEEGMAAFSDKHAIHFSRLH